MALIPPFSFNCVVALGRRQTNRTVRWVGTGTLIGRLYKKVSEREGRYHLFLVTNKHVLTNQHDLVIRFNPLEQAPARDFDIPLLNSEGQPRWKGHETLDISVLGIDADFLKNTGVRYDFFHTDTHIITLGDMIQNGVSEGDFIYVLGFPMGIVDPERQYVIARSGIIARLRDTLERDKPDFLIDAFIFPGNSGGPVLYKPEIIHIEGTQSNTQPGLIGIVSGYLPYKDVAVSRQTGNTRVVFEENSGLAAVVPMDYILETIEECFNTLDIKQEDGVPPTDMES